ncbi:M23 family metallopeptidase [Paenibacillus abyssi]|uniref:Metalloendopeptidase n=1 Tax=Paenibacillus abyssi TaxID=1340531 RepID=A0A917FMK8_9BACL|nr:M23 family metallopeptidase [Paenibacillus abyssi]GGF94042.1 metalloendopeptidase [Paenibacillus abyssi]
MTVFRDKNQFRKVGQKIQETFRKFWSKDLKGKKQHQTGSVMAGVHPWRKKPIMLAGGALALLAIALFGGSQYIKAYTVDFYHVYKDGQAIGTVSEPSQVEDMLLQMTNKAQQDNPDAKMVLDTGNITYRGDSGFKTVPENEETLRKLGSMVTAHAVGVEVRVDGKLIGIAKDRATADKVLNKIQAQYVPQANSKNALEVTALAYSEESGTSEPSRSDELVSVKFMEEVQTGSINVAPERITDEEELYNRLVQGTTRPTQYTVQEGDCVGCIADKFDISREIIYTNNPWIKDDIIKVGDVLDLTVLQPALTVRTVENIVETQTIAPPVTIKENPDMREGQTKVIKEGKNGKKRITYKQVKQNGYLMSEELINEEIVAPAVPSIVMKGTKVIGVGTGNFSWPVSNATLTSKFGKRWGRQHKGIDLVGSRSILAADHGIVEFSGTKNGMGITVIINHQNGYKTVYGHLSSLSVKKGEKVEKGDTLGNMGSTGNSTGVHLHFEIHRNGAVQNPLNYL